MNDHLSASQRKIRALEGALTQLKLMQNEYNVFLNYVVACHGYKESLNDGMPLTRDQIEDGDLERVFIVETHRLKKLEILTIKTEISSDGKQMTIRRLPNPTQNPPTDSSSGVNG